MMLGRWTVLAALCFTLGFSPAQAQNCPYGAGFDACMANALGAMQQRNAQSQQQIWQNYLRTYGPWLRREYAKYRGPPITFEQFAYYNLMTANGTNIAGGLQAQQDQFRGNQQANRTLQEGYQSYRQGMYDNSARHSQAAENYSQGAIRGNVGQVDPQTGQTVWLPYSQPYNQPFTSGGHTYFQNQTGYFQWNGYGWTRMTPGR